METVFITGVAGFIGAHLARLLRLQGLEVAGCDHLNPATDKALQRARIQALLHPHGIEVAPLDINDTEGLEQALAARQVGTLVHLAALPGVRASSHRPLEYARSNLQGFASVLEACRRTGVQRVLYASSSSVYGLRGGQFAESDRVGPPTSFYAATKMANEAMALAYRAQMGLNCVGLRFFTVYGPWGRPDMAPFLFAQALRKGQALQLFGHGQPRRDFTYVDDAVRAVARLVRSPLSLPLPEVLNVGLGQPVRILDFVQVLEEVVGRCAVLEMQPLPPDDVGHTCADDRLLNRVVGPMERTPLKAGLQALVQWLQVHDPVDACPAVSTS